jgi:ubiquinone/menaquinone biosynthesis C-methylase UbiE
LEGKTRMQADSPPTSENMHRIWSKEAEVFHKWYPQHTYRGRAVTEAIIRAAGARPGMCVLDIACGSGEPSLAMAKVVGPEGRVVATDLTEEMIAIAIENAKSQGITNIEFRQADATSLPFQNSSFDAVTCRYGVMYFPDVQNALKEIYRVLKPSSKVALVAWGPVEKNPYWKSTIGVLRKYFAPMKREGNPFSFDDPKKLEEELRKAGFEGVASDLVSLPYPFPGPPELAYENFFNTSSILGILDGADQELLEKVRRESIAELGRYYDGKELIMDAVVVLASGVRKREKC